MTKGKTKSRTKDNKGSKSKTETIKGRTIYVYLPTENLVLEWKEYAKKQGSSISKFVFEHVQNSIMKEVDSNFVNRAEMYSRIAELEGDLAKARKDNHMLTLVSKKLDDELRSYRSRAFLEPGSSGVLEYERDLIDKLRDRKFISSDTLFPVLGIDPRDSDVTKAILKQLESLEAYGLVSSNYKGWRWLG